MFKIKIADLVIEIDNKYDYVENFCKKYIVETDECDLLVKATEGQIENEQKLAVGHFSKGYLESICIYRNISYLLPKFNAFVFHAAVIEVDNNGYAFSAKSGTGKTTHTRLWKKLLDDKMQYVNGDKPIIRIVNNKIIAYGTPWCGKEGYNTNKSVELKAICFIERGEQNSIEPLDKSLAAKKFMFQIIMPKDQKSVIKILDLFDYTLKNTNTWLLKCNIDISAAELSYNTIRVDK